MEKTKTIVCSTKAFAEGKPFSTSLTLDMSNLDESDLLEYAFDAIVIKWQGMARRRGEAFLKSLDGKATYAVPKPGTKYLAPPKTAEELITAAVASGKSPDELIAYLEELKARRS